MPGKSQRGGRNESNRASHGGGRGRRQPSLGRPNLMLGAHRRHGRQTAPQRREYDQRGPYEKVELGANARHGRVPGGNRAQVAPGFLQPHSASQRLSAEASTEQRAARFGAIHHHLPPPPPHLLRQQQIGSSAGQLRPPNSGPAKIDGKYRGPANHGPHSPSRTRGHQLLPRPHSSAAGDSTVRASSVPQGQQFMQQGRAMHRGKSGTSSGGLLPTPIGRGIGEHQPPAFSRHALTGAAAALPPPPHELATSYASTSGGHGKRGTVRGGGGTGGLRVELGGNSGDGMHRWGRRRDGQHGNASSRTMGGAIAAKVGSESRAETPRLNSQDLLKLSTSRPAPPQPSLMAASAGLSLDPTSRRRLSIGFKGAAAAVSGASFPFGQARQQPGLQQFMWQTRGHGRSGQPSGTYSVQDPKRGEGSQLGWSLNGDGVGYSSGSGQLPTHAIPSRPLWSSTIGRLRVGMGTEVAADYPLLPPPPGAAVRVFAAQRRGASRPQHLQDSTAIPSLRVDRGRLTVSGTRFGMLDKNNAQGPFRSRNSAVLARDVANAESGDNNAEGDVDADQDGDWGLVRQRMLRRRAALAARQQGAVFHKGRRAGLVANPLASSRSDVSPRWGSRGSLQRHAKATSALKVALSDSTQQKQEHDGGARSSRWGPAPDSGTPGEEKLGTAMRVSRSARTLQVKLAVQFGSILKEATRAKSQSDAVVDSTKVKPTPAQTSTTEDAVALSPLLRLAMATKSASTAAYQLPEVGSTTLSAPAHSNREGKCPEATDLMDKWLTATAENAASHDGEVWTQSWPLPSRASVKAAMTGLREEERNLMSQIERAEEAWRAGRSAADSCRATLQNMIVSTREKVSGMGAQETQDSVPSVGAKVSAGKHKEISGMHGKATELEDDFAELTDLIAVDALRAKQHAARVQARAMAEASEAEQDAVLSSKAASQHERLSKSRNLLGGGKSMLPAIRRAQLLKAVSGVGVAPRSGTEAQDGSDNVLLGPIELASNGSALAVLAWLQAFGSCEPGQYKELARAGRNFDAKIATPQVISLLQANADICRAAADWRPGSSPGKLQVRLGGAIGLMRAAEAFDDEADLLEQRRLNESAATGKGGIVLGSASSFASVAPLSDTSVVARAVGAASEISAMERGGILDASSDVPGLLQPLRLRSMPGLAPAVLLGLGTTALTSTAALSKSAAVVSGERRVAARQWRRQSRAALLATCPGARQHVSKSYDIEQPAWTDDWEDDSWIFPDEKGINRLQIARCSVGFPAVQAAAALCGDSQLLVGQSGSLYRLSCPQTHKSWKVLRSGLPPASFEGFISRSSDLPAQVVLRRAALENRLLDAETAIQSALQLSSLQQEQQLVQERTALVHRRGWAAVSSSFPPEAGFMSLTLSRFCNTLGFHRSSEWEPMVSACAVRLGPLGNRPESKLLAKCAAIWGAEIQATQSVSDRSHIRYQPWDGLLVRQSSIERDEGSKVRPVLWDAGSCDLHGFEAVVPADRLPVMSRVLRLRYQCSSVQLTGPATHEASVPLLPDGTPVSVLAWSTGWHVDSSVNRGSSIGALASASTDFAVGKDWQRGVSEGRQQAVWRPAITHGEEPHSDDSIPVLAADAVLSGAWQAFGGAPGLAESVSRPSVALTTGWQSRRAAAIPFKFRAVGGRSFGQQPEPPDSPVNTQEEGLQNSASATFGPGAENDDVAWSLSEQLVFLERFLHFPKDFPRISSFLRCKSCQDCVAFYYRIKHRAGLKQALRAFSIAQKRRAVHAAADIAHECAARLGVRPRMGRFVPIRESRQALQSVELRNGDGLLIGNDSTGSLDEDDEQGAPAAVAMPVSTVPSTLLPGIGPDSTVRRSMWWKSVFGFHPSSQGPERNQILCQ